jgi:hypothetical protein
MSRPEPSGFEAELEQFGEENVRRTMAYGAYSAGKKPLVESWLRKKVEERQALIHQGDAKHKETEIAIARSAKNAAWVAVVAAGVSVVIAIIAIVVSLKAS